MSEKYHEVEGFLRNLEAGAIGYHEDKIALAIEAEKGKDPCIECPNKTNGVSCGVLTCLPWYRYYQYRWRRLQRRLLNK